MEGEGGVDRAEASDEVIFECLYGPFCFVASVEASWGKLIIDVVCCNFVDEGLRGFIVEALELWMEST